jgi:hypothetical protein
MDILWDPLAKEGNHWLVEGGWRFPRLTAEEFLLVWKVAEDWMEGTTFDTESEAFWALMDRMWKNTDAMRKHDPAGGFLSGVKVVLLKAANALTFVQLFLRTPHRQALPADVRMQPVW